jgi:hypothetical protein
MVSGAHHANLHTKTNAKRVVREAPRRVKKRPPMGVLTAYDLAAKSVGVLCLSSWRNYDQICHYHT